VPSDSGLPLPSETQGKTGVGLTRRWQFVVPEGQVLIIESYAALVNGSNLGGPGVYIAYPASMPIDMTLTDGAYYLVETAKAQARFCELLGEGEQRNVAQNVIIGLPAWGRPPCSVLPGCGDSIVPCDGRTGVGQTRSWQFTVPDGQALLIEAVTAAVNGVTLGNSGVFVAYPAGTFVDMTLTDGAYRLVEEAEAQAKFCEVLAYAEQQNSAREVVVGLTDWGNPPC
jgi:hypothetical protein